MEQPLLNLEPSADKKKLVECAMTLYTANAIPAHTFKLIEKKIKEMFDGEQVPIPKSKRLEKLKETFEERRKAFEKSLAPFVKIENKNSKHYNPTGLYSPDMVRDFFDWFSEGNKDLSEMRWEKETSFELSKRLSTWSRRDWNKEKAKKEEKQQSKKVINFPDTWSQSFYYQHINNTELIEKYLKYLITLGFFSININGKEEYKQMPNCWNEIFYNEYINKPEIIKAYFNFLIKKGFYQSTDRAGNLCFKKQDPNQ